MSDTIEAGVRRLPADSPAIDAFVIGEKVRTNLANAADANGDGSVAPGDAPLVINAINKGLHALRENEGWLAAGSSSGCRWRRVRGPGRCFGRH